MEYNPTNEQKLIDIIFETGVMIHEHPQLKKMNREQLTKWISIQLNGSGFVTEQVGNRLGVLREIR